MSLTSDYWKAKKKLEEEAKSTAKTGGTSSGANVTVSASTDSLTSDYLNAKKKLEEEIAPISSRVTNRLTISDIAPYVGLIQKEEDEKQKWYQGWFQNGALEDGLSLENISKTILGTITDVGQDLATGIVGIGEKAVDAFMMLAPYSLMPTDPYMAASTREKQAELFEEAKKGSDEFVKKDLYDEEAVAKKLLSTMFGNAQNISKLQSGQMLSEDDLVQGQKSTKVAQEYLDGQMEADSVLGAKTDALGQSGGQLLGTLALSAVGVPWWLTSGANAFGGESENALKQGATHEEAVLSSAIAAGAEVLTEKLSGGISFGGKTLDDVVTTQISRGISNKYLRTAAKLGLDMFGEGAEEWITEDLNKFGQWLTYRDDEELRELLFSEEAMQEKIEAFIGGSALGFVSNVGNAAKSKADGVDYASGLKNSEEAVVRKVYDDLVSEAKKDGKVTSKEKTKIYDRVLRELEKGGISTDVIESVLDQEGYNEYNAAKDGFFAGDPKKAYNEAMLAEAAELNQLQQKLEELIDAPNTVGNNRLYDSIVSKITELTENPGSSAIKAQLDSEVKRINEMHNDLRTKVHEMVKGTKLEESYNELIRSQQKYEVDVTKYTDPNARKTIENILKSGKGDNSNHFHEYADWLAKISADKGMSFSLTDNEALKGTEHDFSKEGLITNGYKTADGIVLNMDSPKALNSTVGHEITHVLEQNTELYQTLQDTVFKYEIAKNGQEAFDKRLQATIKRYQGKDADAKAELTADLVGDYLFTDYDFVHNLSVENRNVFQKIYDEIKYLCKVVTAGSKEARELEKVKKVFDDAYRANVKGKADTKTQHSISYTTDNRAVATINSDIFDGKFEELSESERVKIVKNAIKEFRPGIPVSGRLIGITRKSAEHFTNSDYTDKLRNNDRQLYEDKLNIAQNIDDVVYASTDYINEELKHPRKDNIEQFARGTVLLDIGGNKYEASVVVGYTSMHQMVLYDVQDLTPTNFETKKKMQPTLAGNESDTRMTVASSFDTNVAQNGNGVKYSLSDSDGREVSPAVAQRFGNSKAVDENGNLKVLYHGTASGEFSIFDKTKGSVEGDFGSGFYFTDDPYDVENNYEGGGPDFDNKVGRRADEIWGEEDIEYEEAEKRAKEELYKGSHKFEVYLNIENPAVVGETILFDPDSYYSQYNQEDYDSEDDYLADVEQLIADEIDNIIWEVERNVDINSTDGIADVLWGAFNEGGVDAELLKKRLNSLYLEDSNGNLVANEVARQIIESLGYDGIIDPTVSTKWNMDMNAGTTHYIVFKPNQIKAVTNQNPTDNPDIHRSLSNIGGKTKQYGDWNVYGSDFGYKGDFAPTIPTPNRNVLPGERMSVSEMFPDEPDVSQAEYDNLVEVKDALEARMFDMADKGDFTDLEKVNEEWVEAKTRLAEIEAELSAADADRLDSLSDADAPPEMDAPILASAESAGNPFADRDWYEVGTNRKTQAFMRENPEFKPFFQEEALNMLGELADSQKGERWYNDEVYYASGGEKGFGGNKRLTSQDIAQMLDEWGLTYDQITEGLTAIAEDNDKVNNAPAKRIEFMLNQRLMNGYKDFHTDKMVEPNQAYLETVREWQYNQQTRDNFDSFMETADQYAPMDDIAPIAKTPVKPAPVKPAPVKPTVKTKPNAKTAQVLTKASKKPKDSGIFGKVVSAVVDKGAVFEKLSLDTKNMEVQAKWNYALPTNTEARAQYFMENGENGAKSLKSVMKEVGKKKDLFQNYLYHVHNIDRMTLKDRFGTPNKAVFGDSITADISRKKAAQLLKQNPEFKRWAQDIYKINKQVRSKMVEGGLISQEVAKLWEQMYPHYVPVTRVDKNGLNVNVPLDTNKTGVNNPVKRATGGNSDIEPLFNSMAQRIEQTYRAIARNSFGIELKNTLGTAIDSKPTSGVDEMIDAIEMQDELLKHTFGMNPTFTVFENGERVEFEITEDMYDALKPMNKILAYRNKPLTAVSEMRRNLLTVWNPVFALYRNPIKDMQDVAVNSQHAARTYANVPNAMYQLLFGGKYADEYHQNGGKSNTYFDGRKNEFKERDNIFKNTIGLPLKAIETAGEFIEEIPRLSEYIASRKQGRSVERSMLDAARVTTNFAAAGDFTKFINAHGFTFLNASVQGASQHVRNFREATKLEGFKGFTKTLAKYVIAGVPAMILNARLWEDDEEYEELNDYVKENYFVVAKTEDGKFIRIPKGRTTAVMHEVLEQMQNLVTGDDEVDFSTFFELFMNNIAPNNPLTNNIFAPIGQAIKNNAWYEGDIVPSRLQDLPAEEQFDESTDSISKWLGEKTGLSPMKLNYLLDQYSGGLGDVFLPMLTPEAESGDNSFIGNLLAPWKKEITTDMVLNNKNPGDFYDLRDELEVNANAKNATDEDKMKALNMDTVSWQMGDLYAQKREIQSSDLSDSVKYKRVRELQEQINELAKNAMSGYENVSINGLYSEVGDKRFNLDKESGTWYEIKPKNSDGSDSWYYQMEQDVTKALGIDYGEYWNNREEYNYAYEKPEQYTLSKAVGGYEAYRSFTSHIYDLKADKDANGESISGSKKAKVYNYIFNELDADYGEKIILYRSQYDSKADRAAYDEDIFYYLIGREDISWDEMVTILKGLDFNVDANGNVSW